MLINEKNEVFEGRIQMWLKSELNDDGIVVAVNVGIDSIQAFEHLAYERSKGLWKGNTYR